MSEAELLAALAAGWTIEGGSELHLAMHVVSQEALRITAELSGGYHSPDEVRALLSRLTGVTVPASLTVFPPFFSDLASESVSARTFSSIRARTSRTKVASPSVRAR